MKLSNSSFMDKAPAEVIGRERDRRAELATVLARLEEVYAKLG